MRSPRSNSSNSKPKQNSMKLAVAKSLKNMVQQRVIDEKSKLSLSYLLKFKDKYIKEANSITTPITLLNSAKYRSYKQAQIIKRDYERAPVADYMLSNLFKIYVLLHENEWI